MLEKSPHPIVYQKGEGAGIGLDVVKDLVQGYGDPIGDIVLELYPIQIWGVAEWNYDLRLGLKISVGTIAIPVYFIVSGREEGAEDA